MRRIAAAIAIALIVVGLPVIGPAGRAEAARPAAKVAIVVGPAGAASAGYIRLADQAAAAAKDHGAAVVRVYTPNATWPAVREALDGASVVVYLGHGNGWPSQYRDSLYPATQNGFGLNPVAGDGDSHQYFGETYVGGEVKLASHAVVVLSHLCYASGNTEPGLPEGSLADARQRVDNYAAGFIRAGADAVIAEAHMGPAWYVDQVLDGKKPIDGIWRSAPTANGNLIRFDSQRSPGFTAQMDPDEAASGFYRSLVLRSGLTAPAVLSGARGIVATSEVLAPSLNGVAVHLSNLDLLGRPEAGTTIDLRMSVSARHAARIPKLAKVGVRWTRLDAPSGLAPSTTETAPTVSDASGAAPAPSDASASASPAAHGAAEAGGSDATTVQPVDPAPIIDLVRAEVPGEIVAPVTATIKIKRGTATGTISAKVALPPEPGLYRLETTIHDADGVAYDPVTQGELAAQIVRVIGPIAVGWDVGSTAKARPGGALDLKVGVVNLGALAWGKSGDGNATSADTGRRTPDTRLDGPTRGMVVARWVNLGVAQSSVPADGAGIALPPALKYGAGAWVTFRLVAPTTEGDYLILLDVITPESGSLAAAGADLAIVRVTVSSTPEVSPSPAAGAGTGAASEAPSAAN
jgi:hypothetical protein